MNQKIFLLIIGLIGNAAGFAGQRVLASEPIWQSRLKGTDFSGWELKINLAAKEFELGISGSIDLSETRVDRIDRFAFYGKLPSLFFGPLLFNGWLAEIHNPAGLKPDSSSLSEKSYLLLDRSIDSGQRQGLVWRAVPDSLDFFVIRQPDEVTNLGLFSRSQMTGGVIWETIQIASYFPLNQAADPWLFAKPALISRQSYSSYWRFLSRLSYLEFDISAGAVWAPRDRTALIVRLATKWLAGDFTFQTLQQFASTEFYTPSGNKPALPDKFGWSLTYRHLNTLSLQGEYLLNLPAVTDTDNRYLDIEHQAVLWARLRIAPLAVKAIFDYTRDWNQNGFPDFKQKYALDISFFLKQRRLYVKTYYLRQKASETYSLSLEGVFKWANIWLKAGLTGRGEYPGVWQVTGRLTIDAQINQTRLALTLSLKDYPVDCPTPADFFNFSFQWRQNW